MTFAVADRVKFCALERSIVTTFDAIESDATASLVVLILIVPSTSKVALGTVVPIPTEVEFVVIIVPPDPTTSVVAVIIPALTVPPARL